MPKQGRIIKSISGFYEVYTEGVIYRCRAKGVFRALHEKPLVGDEVLMEVTDTVSDPPEGNVVKLLPRKNDLIRPNVANVDQALLLFAITNPAPSYNMLDRFLITMKRKNLPAILCFNKLDLATPEQTQELKEVYENCGCKVLFIQATDPSSLDRVKEVLAGKTTVITGPSGAGKSSLINRLCPNAHRETGEISKKIGRGKNTTRVVELLPASIAPDDPAVHDLEASLDAYSTFLVDTPGFTSLFLQDVTAEDVKAYYPEFEPLAAKCRFLGCNHMAEPGCAVKAARDTGTISRIRYQNYTEIYTELKDQRPDYKTRKKS